MTATTGSGRPEASAIVTSAEVGPTDDLHAHVLLACYRAAATTPGAVISRLLDELDAADPAIFIDRVEPDVLRRRAASLEAEPDGPARLPLYGVPFAVKDNLDVAERQTTAACSDYSRIAEATATAVALLERAGAILVGKTNLDQFATGLVGTRSPYGVPRNPRAAEHVPGGSSSGSAVAVAAGLVSFALGTDTAGSGRVPAAMTGVLGVKPTRGLVSTTGVVPACPSLDCVSIFADDARDAALILDVLDRHDPHDPWSRRPGQRTRRPADEVAALRLGVPAPGRLEPGMAEAFRAHVRQLTDLGLREVPIDLRAFERAGQLLYEGPWMAERLAAVSANLDGAPGLLPVIREVLEDGHRWSAVDTFRSIHELESLRRAVDEVFAEVDLIVVPSVPSQPTLAEVARDPIAVNASLGRFTNFVNLLDLAAVAAPGGELDGVPVGFTLIGPALSDRTLLAVAAAHSQTPLAESRPADTAQLAVVGAHLRGQPLHHELVEAGARLVTRTTTAATYRLYQLAEADPPKPGLVADPDGGCIEVELYELPATQLQAIRARVAPPLSIGSTRLVDGRTVDGFVCDPAAIDGATDITRFGGWRAFLEDSG